MIFLFQILGSLVLLFESIEFVIEFDELKVRSLQLNFLV